MANSLKVIDYLFSLPFPSPNYLIKCQMFDDGATAYLGVASPNFPNFFMLGGPYSLVSTHSSLLSAEFQERDDMVAFLFYFSSIYHFMFHVAG